MLPLAFLEQTLLFSRFPVLLSGIFYCGNLEFLTLSLFEYILYWVLDLYNQVEGAGHVHINWGMYYYILDPSVYNY
jgi:hypothetical protein